MNKVVKILLLLGSLILMALFGAVAITTWLADTAWQPPDNVQWFLQDNEYARQAIFWVALVLLGIMLFLFLFILLFPRRKGTFELKEEQGKLVLHRKAIEGFVRSSLQDSDFLEAPTIRVKATKRRIKVNVKGTLKRTADLIGQTEAWSKTMEERLARLVGAGHKITIDVHFEDIQSMKRPQQQQTQARVE